MSECHCEKPRAKRGGTKQSIMYESPHAKAFAMMPIHKESGLPRTKVLAVTEFVVARNRKQSKDK
jgi:hypothetical protein